MSGKRIIFYILGAFVIGTIVLVYVEYNSTKHVNALVTSNQKLLSEFQITQNLLNAAKSKVVVERKIRGFIESGDTSYLIGLDTEFHEIESAKTFLLTISDDSTTISLIQELDSLIQLKINLFNNFLSTNKKYGVKAAEDTINANLLTWVSYDIENSIRKITNTRGHQLTLITENVRKSGQKALWFSYILIALVLLATALVFWYIIYIIRKLIQSEKKVRENARIKENFLANMSHEIRTPMNAIVGFTQLLSQKDLDEESKHYVNTIQRSGENLLAIVNDILDISKIEAGMMRIEIVPFSLRGLVNSIENMMLPKANDKGISFTTDIDRGIPDVLEGDAIRLTQILSNLLSNALKFTSQGTILLEINTAEISNHTVKLKINISDTGIGIEPQKLDHIFGRFQQADDTITRQYGGTGLGLSIVKDLVELQHGTITAESEPGKGTSFHVTIPYAISTKQITDTLSVSEATHVDSISPNVNILITEDNEFNQSLLSHIFRNRHIQFDIANNGAEAIEKLKANKFDLVLMDIQMPVMDGYTAARKIRNELKSSIPIIAMTAHAMPGEKEKCLSYGMNDYISKPVKQEHLIQLISRFTAISHPIVKKDSAINDSNAYQYISLHYLREVSAGNKKYERDVTQKFLNAVPLAMQEIQNSLDEGNKDKMQRIAHNLKTTISVMGLNDILNPVLDEIESGDANPELYQERIHEINYIFTKAMAEARAFLSSL